jgi:hypothetical protein
MQSSTHPESPTLLTSSGGLVEPRRREDLMYQVVTVAAILLVLGSVWVF